MRKALETSKAWKEKYNGMDFEKPTLSIERITSLGEITIRFSSPMYAPSDYSFLNGESRLNGRQLQSSDDELNNSNTLFSMEECTATRYNDLTTLLKKVMEVNLYPEDMDDWEDRNLHFDWNVTDFEQNSFKIQIYFEEAV